MKFKKYKYWLVLMVFFIAGISYFMWKKNKHEVVLPEIKPAAKTVSGLKMVAVTSEYFTDMEDPDPGLWLGEKSPDKKYSGKFSNKISDKTDYGMTFYRKGADVPGHEKFKQVRISLQLYSALPLTKASIVYAVTGAPDKVFEYSQENIIGTPKKWNHLEFIVPVNPSAWGQDALIKIYPWNEGKESFFIDDLKIEFFGEVSRQTGFATGPQQNFIFDFEQSDGSSESLSKDIAHSGSYSIKLSGTDSYSENIIKRFSEVSTDTIKFISTSVWIYPKEEDPVFATVVSIEKPDGQSISWQGKATDRMHLVKNQWHKINFRADLRDLKITPDDVAKIYLWNKKGGTVYADDLEIIYGDVPKPTGIKAGMMMSIFGDPVTRMETNKPPFPFTYLTPVTRFAPRSLFLVDDENGKAGEMNPADLVLAGNFSGHHISQDDIFIAGQATWSLFSWCNNENKFRNICSEKAGFSLAGKIALTGFFDAPAAEEILFVDTIGKIKVQTVRFNNPPDDVCDEKSKGAATTVISSVEIQGFETQEKSWKMAAGDFAGDARDEILFISTDGIWKLVEKNKETFTVVASGKISKGTVLAAQVVPFNNLHKSVLVFTEQKQTLDYCLLDFGKGGKKADQIELKDKSFLALYSANSTFYSGRFERPSETGCLYLDHEWRFDLKKIRVSPSGIIVDSQLDFSQPDPNRNPRFYEFTKLISGNFFATGEDCLLIMMRNCKDENFNGISCNEYEEVSGMPSGYMFYQFWQGK